MSVELIQNIIAKRLSAIPAGISAAADTQGKQRLITFSQGVGPDVCQTLKRTGLAERAIDHVAAGTRFHLSEVDEALEKAPVLSGTRGDTQNMRNRMGFKAGLQELGLL